MPDHPQRASLTDGLLEEARAKLDSSWSTSSYVLDDLAPQPVAEREAEDAAIESLETATPDDPRARLEQVLEDAPDHPLDTDEGSF